MNFETIAAYLAGDLPTDQKQEVERWISQSEVNKQTFSKWQVLWKASRSTFHNYKPDVDAAWAKIKPDGSNSIDKPKIQRNMQRNDWPWISKVAATILLIAGLGFATVELIKYTNKPDTVWHESEATDLQLSRVQLADGTRVWLNAQSKIRYPEPFSPDAREVYLEGEAYFEVAKRVDHPFIISSGQSRTTVLGTSFNVRAFPNEPSIILTVHSGKVAFENIQKKGSGKVILPDYRAELIRSTGHISESVNTDPNYLAWKTGKLIFRNTRLKDALKSIETYYAVKFEVSDSSLLNCRFTGTFDQAPLEDILEVFSYGSEIVTAKNGTTFLLSGAGCK